MVKKRVTGTAVYSPSGLLQKISVCNDDNRCVEFYATPNHTNSFVEVGGNNNNYNFNRRKATPRIKQTSVAAKQAEEVIGDVKLVETKLQKDTKTWRAFLTRANIKTLVGVALTIWSVGLMFFYGGALSASLLNSIKAFIAAGLPQKVRWVITWVKRYDYIKRYIHPLGPFRFAMNYYIGHPTALQAKENFLGSSDAAAKAVGNTLGFTGGDLLAKIENGSAKTRSRLIDTVKWYMGRTGISEEVQKAVNDISKMTVRDLATLEKNRRLDRLYLNSEFNPKLTKPEAGVLAWTLLTRRAQMEGLLRNNAKNKNLNIHEVSVTKGAIARLSTAISELDTKAKKNQFL